MICSVIGNQIKSFPFDYENDLFKKAIYTEALYNEVEALIKQGYNHFITGTGRGVDIDFGEAVLYFKNNGYSDYNIKLETVTPGERAGSTYSDEYWESYNYVVECSDIVTKVSGSSRSRGRKEYIVDHSDLVLSVWNGDTHGGTWEAIKYAKNNNKDMRFIMINEIKM